MLLRPLLSISLLSAASVGQSAAAEVRYYSLIIAGKKTGYVRVQEEPQGAGLKVSADCFIKVTMLGAPFDVRYQAIADYAKPDAVLPERYTQTLDQGPRKITTDCRFIGKKIEVDYEVNGAKEHKSLALPDKCVLVEGNLPETWERAFRSLGAVKGEQTISVFSPATASITPMQASSDKPGSWKASQSGTSLTFATNAAGRITQFDVPSQSAKFTLADKEALTGLEGMEAASRAFAVSNVALENSLGLKSLVIDVDASVAGEKIDESSLQLPRQSFSGKVEQNKIAGRMTIRQARYDGENAAMLPLSAAQKQQYAAFLKGDVMVEVDDPEIRRTAATVANGSKTTWEAAKKIGNWVHENIAYKISGVGARQCLKEKSGDCGPHSWLSIALLRAAGVPARITGGALYSDLLGGSFGQHYWTEVWAGEKPGWVPIDTTTGEIGTLSPTHLNLWRRTGGIASLSVKVVDFAPKAGAASATANEPVSPRKPIGLHSDEAWSFNYSESGKAIGKETAKVTRLDPSGEADIEYKIDLKIAETDVSCTGKMTVLADATPKGLSLKVVQSGLEQTVDSKVEGQKIKAHIEAAGIKNDREFDLPAGGYMGLALSSMTWDLLCRTVDWQVGKPVTVSVYLLDSLRMEKIKLEPTKEQSVKIGSREFACYAVKAGGHEQFYVEKGTGRLIRAVPGGDKMVVERVE